MNRRAVFYQVRNALRRRGLTIGRTDPDCPSYGFLELVVFPALNINCVIDVGASQGEFGGHLRDFGYAGRIVSFEPVSDNYRILLAKSEADPNWVAHHYAIGPRNEDTEIHVARGSFWSSILTPSSYGAREFGGEIDVTGTERVQMRQLDSLFDECVQGLADPRVFLKVDTQGYDRQVLLGAEACLSQIPALQTEISFQQEYERMTPAAEMIEFVEGLGYSLSGIYKVFRDSRLSLVEADGVFVRPASLA